MLRILSLLLALTGCGSGPGAPEDGGEEFGEGVRLLFVGNSLTYTNDVPAMVGWMLEEAGVEVGRIASVAFPNFGLQDHWESSAARSLIAEGGWSVVVLQQGPSATEGRPSLLDYSQRFSAEIRRGGARPALYMVWPSPARFFDFDGVSNSYATAAEMADGLLYPAGEAWRAAWRGDPNLALYGPDQFHPSPMGSYLAALVMFEQIAGKDPHVLPAVIATPSGNIDLTSELASLLHDSAREANELFARKWPRRATSTGALQSRIRSDDTLVRHGPVRRLAP